MLVLFPPMLLPIYRMSQTLDAKNILDSSGTTLNLFGKANVSKIWSLPSNLCRVQKARQNFGIKNIVSNPIVGTGLDAKSF